MIIYHNNDNTNNDTTTDINNTHNDNNHSVEKASGLLRPLGAGSGDAASAAQKAEAEVSSDYAKGDKVEVFAYCSIVKVEVFAYSIIV